MPAPKTLEQKRDEVLARTSEQQNGSGDSRRRKRSTFTGTSSKLAVDKTIDGYKLYWMNDEPGRIPQAIEIGYEHVKEKEVYSYSDSEEYVKRHVGTSEKGDGMVAYLMKIRQDWYEEDQAEIQAKNDQFDAAIRNGKLDAPKNSYGAENIKYSA